MIEQKGERTPSILGPRHFTADPDGKAEHHRHGVVPDEHGDDDGVHNDIRRGKGNDALVNQTARSAGSL